MIEKKFIEAIPFVFRSRIKNYWKNDFSFLINGEANENSFPSLAALLSESCARRKTPFYDKQALLIKENYNYYLELAIDKNKLAYLTAMTLVDKLMATNTLLSIGVSNPEAYVTMDIFNIRNAIYNPPIVDFADICKIENQFSFLEINECSSYFEFVIKREDYNIAVVQSLFSKNNPNDAAVFDGFLKHNLLDDDKNKSADSLIVLEFFVFKDDSAIEKQCFCSVCYTQDVSIPNANSEYEQMIKDAIVVVNAFNKGKLREKQTPAKLAWDKLKKSKNILSIKQTSLKLYGRRYMELT